MKPVGCSLMALALTVTTAAAVAATPAVIETLSDEPAPIHRGLDGQLLSKATPTDVACNARNGDEIEILKGVALESGREFWLLVKVLSGPCARTQGWIRGTHAKPRT